MTDSKIQENFSQVEIAFSCKKLIITLPTSHLLQHSKFTTINLSFKPLFCYDIKRGAMTT